MVEFFGFGVQIALIFGVHAHHQRHTFGNADAAVAQGLQFFGVVGQQFHGLHVQIIVNMLGDAEIARIHGQPQSQIGFHRVHAFILQGIGADFVDESNAAAFLPQIHQHAAPFGLNRRQSSL